MNASGKARQEWKTRTGTKFTKPGAHLLAHLYAITSTKREPILYSDGRVAAADATMVMAIVEDVTRLRAAGHKYPPCQPTGLVRPRIRSAQTNKSSSNGMAGEEESYKWAEVGIDHDAISNFVTNYQLQATVPFQWRLL